MNFCFFCLSVSPFGFPKNLADMITFLSENGQCAFQIDIVMALNISEFKPLWFSKRYCYDFEYFCI
jgi:hypothetical protein